MMHLLNFLSFVWRTVCFVSLELNLYLHLLYFRRDFVDMPLAIHLSPQLPSARQLVPLVLARIVWAACEALRNLGPTASELVVPG